MKKIVIANLNKAAAGVVFDQWNPPPAYADTAEKTDISKEKACYVQLFQKEHPSLIGNIYIGHVRDVVRNIEAAFVEFDSQTLGYLSFKNAAPVFVNRKNTEKICEGDNLIVQVAKDKIKTKDAVLTANFELPGRFAVITHGKSGISFSSKIRDEHYKRTLSDKLQTFLTEKIPSIPYGIIIRTEAYHAEYENITEELLALDAEYHRIIELAKTRQKYYMLKQAEPEVLRFLKSSLEKGKECEIITDDSRIYSRILENKVTSAFENCSIRFYEDKLLPLYKLYSLENVFHDIYSDKVWLKSGAYLVIEYTEAMTVIDVNTGKCEKGKSKEATFLKINLEAALEIARQLRIRNISGIIIVDFIDMPLESHVKALLEYTRQVMSEDPVKTTVVDITRLHLMEITRRKTTDKIPYIADLFEKPNTP